HNTVMLGETAFPGDPELGWLADTDPPQALVHIAAGEGSDEVERRVIHDGSLVIVVDTFALAREQEAGSAWSALGPVAVLSHDTALDPPPRNSGGLGPAPTDGPWAGLTDHRYLHASASDLVHLRWPCAPGL